jgi:regulator of sigma E protease
MLTTILATLVVLGVLILVHELGHFWAAKAVDIEVPRFSIGFGPKVVGFRRGETEFVISALPLGGYVKMAGMEEMEHIEGGPEAQPGADADSAAPRERGVRRARDFESKPLWARAFVISAGVIMNLLFAVVVFAAVAMAYGVPAVPEPTIGGIVEERLPPGTEALADVDYGARVTRVGNYDVADFNDLRLAFLRSRAGSLDIHFEQRAPVTIELPAVDTLRASLVAAFEPVLAVPPVIGHVEPGGPGEQGGLRSGDRVVRAGERDIETWQQLVAAIEQSPGRPIALVVQRNGASVPLELVPEARVLETGREYGRIQVGVAPGVAGLPREHRGVVAAAGHGVRETWQMMTLIVDFLGGMFTGRQSPRDVGGPLLIGELSGQFARAGLEAFLSFMAIFSVNLAILNLLPIPVLDGGHLVFLAIEGVRGRPLSIDQRMRFTQVGLVVIIGIMVWALGNDLLRFFGI